jgi:1-acyl-sn-glycerol-3-phosphate acyltransferase
VSGVVYACLWLLCNAVARLCFRFQVVGQERVPKRGGVLVAANHASYLDIPLLGSALRRRAWYMGRQDLFGPRVFKWMCRELGWIPIRLNRLDRGGFAKAVALIKEGKVVVIYPEGTRTVDGALQPGKPGLGVIVEETGCPVVPAYIAGAYDVLPTGRAWVRFKPVQVAFGEPIDFTKDRERFPGKEFYRHVSRTVMARIAEVGHVRPPADRAGDSAAGPLNAE